MRANKHSAPLPALGVSPHPGPFHMCKLHLPLLDFIQSQVVNAHGHCADDFEIGSCRAEKALFVSFLMGFKATTLEISGSHLLIIIFLE